MRKIILALAMLVASSAQAAMIRYELTFVVEQVGGGGSGEFNDPAVQSFFVGEVFRGSLLVDDVILTADGVANAGMPRHLRITMGDTVWAQDFSSDLAGFRGPCSNYLLSCTTEQQYLWGLGSEYLGFEVAGGVVTGLWGGVYGFSDMPYIDFRGATFGAEPYRLLPGGTSWVTDGDMEFVSGRVMVNRVPVSSTFALMSLGLLLVARRR